MKINKILLIILVIFLLSVITSSFFLRSFLLNSFKRISIDFKVGDHSGFNADPDALHFGTLIPGSNGFRDFQVQNIDCNKCKVVIKSDLEWVVLDNNNFILKRGEKKTVKIFLYVPQNANFGQYNSSLDIYLWKTI